MPVRGSPYGPDHQRERALRLAPGVACVHCKVRQATELDHDPPLALHLHVNGSGCCRRLPSCGPCARAQGGRIATGRPVTETVVDVQTEEVVEPDGFPVGDPVWEVPWLEELREVPDGAIWPRLMTAPHPAAVGSLGGEFAGWARARTGRGLRWWQRLAAARILEHDEDERLVWEAVLLTMARQLGKSWLLRELFLWRIHQGDRFGEPQDVVHTGMDVQICKEVQRPARFWAKARPETYSVREANGEVCIEVLADGSRWLLKAKDAVYGFAASVAGADEAWKVSASSIEEGLVPTMAERNQAQLLLVSTAHRLSTTLMLDRRHAALNALATGDGDLLVEWSAPRDAELDDVAAWRAASPHWTAHRQRLVDRRLAAALAGEGGDLDEPDPVEGFRSQWLNVWPSRTAAPARAPEPLLPEGAWAACTEHVDADGPVWIACEDDFGRGAAVAAAARLEDGRIEVDGWLAPTWEHAIGEARALLEDRPGSRLLVGASMLASVPSEVRRVERAGTTETRTGLPLLRDLVARGGLVHDDGTAELDEAVDRAKVREVIGGLQLVPQGAPHLVRAAVWAVQEAQRPRPRPAIY
jgi:hypothetical protein